MKEKSIRVGCAGWSIPKRYAVLFPGDGSHLERYARRLPAVEINSTFKKSHRPSTFRRWAESVPEEFKFSLKMPKQITHEQRPRDLAGMESFLEEISELGDKLGPLLVQLPPSLEFDAKVVKQFFTALHDQFSGELVCEPRHPSWFQPKVDHLFVDFEIARVAADPPKPQAAAEPGGWSKLVYYRLHGAPRMYYSEYSDEFLDSLIETLLDAERSASVCCIFDNTASGAATANALYVTEELQQGR